MKLPKAPFVAAVAAASLGAAVPAMAQEAPTTTTTTSAPAAPVTGSRAPSVNVLGATVTLNGVETGVAVNARTGRVRTYVSPDVEVNTGRPIVDALAGIALSDVSIGDRFVSSGFDRMTVNLSTGNFVVNSAPRTDTTSFRTQDDKLFGPSQFAGFNLNQSGGNGSPIIGVGADLRNYGVGVAVIEGQKPNDRTTWRLQASAGFHGVNASAEVRHNLTDNIQLHGIAGTDGLAGRITYDRRLSDSFRISAQGSASTRYGLTGGLQGTYTQGRTNVSMGVETQGGPTFYTTIRRTF